MNKEFKASSTQFNLGIGMAIFAIVATIVGYLLLNVFITMLPIFAVFWSVLAFWGKDRVLVTLHDDYLEAKEAIAAKKKLIKYNDIVKAEMHRSGKLITLYVKTSDGKDNKKTIGINSIKKTERTELFDLITSKITNTN